MSTTIWRPTPDIASVIGTDEVPAGAELVQHGVARLERRRMAAKRVGSAARLLHVHPQDGIGRREVPRHVALEHVVERLSARHVAQRPLDERFGDPTHPA